MRPSTARRIARRRRRYAIETLEDRLVMAASVYVTEFVADNDGGLQDVDGDRSDWIELFNAGDAPALLAGWQLVNNLDHLEPWTFPAVTIDAGEYLLVFASDKDRRDPAAELHANFRLASDGEYLGLLDAEGAVVHEYAPQYPAQSARASYGLPQSVQATVLLTEDSPARAFVPTIENGGDQLGLSWTSPEFDDSAWNAGTLGLGFERQSGYQQLIGVDVNDAMFGVGASAYLRVPFESAAAAEIASLKLRLKYDDGFAAYLNGELVAARNAPDPLDWDSAATAQHPDIAALEFEDIDVTAFKGALRDGPNVLAIHGLNASASNGDFLILPELIAEELAPLDVVTPRYFTTPTPGAANTGAAYAGIISDPSFSSDRGFYFDAQSVTLTTNTPGAEIRYTTDGSTPTQGRGTLYTAPINVTTTSTLRAAAFKSDYAPSHVVTQTLIFPESVIQQPASPPGLPSTWDGTPADYQMDPDVVNSPAYKDEMVAALQSIPTMSIVTEQDNLFGPSNGIYVHSTQEGDAWERPTSVELILPDGTTGFQEDAGIRIWGTGWRPHSSSLKHSFQLKFKPEYGASKLEYPLFPDAPVDKFDDIVLRAQGSKSWNDFRQPDINQTQYIHDAWARDTARDMGKVDGHATFVHLYLNGLYWGLYNPVERTNESFGEEYFGGDDEDYDVISRRAGIPNEATHGDLTAWNQMMALANQGLSTPEQYAAIQLYLDVDDLIDYMLIQQYATNHDGPDNDGNNMRAMRRRDADGRFRFFVWDMEYTFWYPGELRNVNVDVADTATRLYARLRQNSEFRLRYADHVREHFYHGGALTPEASAERWQARADEIYSAVIAESARWGDVRRGAPYTRDVEWNAELERLIEEYFPVRTQVLLGQLRDAGLYPTLEAPEFNQHGGEIGLGFELDIDAPRGDVYYTMDGSDPRLPGGAVNPSAKVVTPNKMLVGPTSAARVFVPRDNALGSRWTGGDSRFSDADWLSGLAAVGFDAAPAGVPVNVALANATADFSQPGFSVASTIDGNPSGAGWGLSQNVDYQGPIGIAGTAVFETVNNLGYEAGTLLTFTLTHDAINQHNIGRLRLTFTTDDRATFADGLATHGDVTASWTTLAPLSFVSSGGSTMTLKSDGSMLVSGGSNQRDTYTITVVTPAQNITGFRLETINDASLPNRGGPGRSANGNAVLTEFSITAAPAKLNHLADAGLSDTLQTQMLAQNASAYVRIPFEQTEVGVYDRLLLNMQYADGFMAYLNGHEVARRNVVGDVAFNSSAQSRRANGLAMTVESIDITAFQQFLKAGENILAIQVLNDNAADATLLVRPSLVGQTDAHEPLVQSTLVKARVLDGGVWSALTSAEFLGPTPLRVTELMYHPRDPEAGSPYAGGDFEFIEIVNAGAAAIDLTGVRFTRGIDFSFDNGAFAELAPGERAVIVHNAAAFSERYGQGFRIIGEFTGQLDNAGERLTLSDAGGRPILDFTYDDAWYPSTDGPGRSLVIIDASGAPEQWNQAAAWKASEQLDGSPGLAEPSGISGDTDADGDVDLVDLNNVRNYFGGRGLGDADGDRDVDLADLNAVRNHFGALAALRSVATASVLALQSARAKVDALDAVFARLMDANADEFYSPLITKRDKRALIARRLP